MNLNRKSFTYRLYSWCHVLSNKLFNNNLYEYEGGIEIPTNANLCPMMRTIFIWTPVYLALFATLLFGLGYILFYLPNTFGGIVGYMNTYLIPAVVIGGIVGFFWLIAVGYEKYADRHIETMEEMEARHEAGNYTFWEMICNWYIARHEKLCPAVNIVDDAPVEPVDDKEIVEEVVDDKVVEVDKEVEETVAFQVDINVETPASAQNKSVDVKFLNKWSPDFSVFIATACVIALVALLNWVMAFAMETDEIVFEKAQCVGSYDADNLEGKITCGDHVLDIGTSKFITTVILLKKTPICEVTKGTLTDDVEFDCEYK